MIVLYRGLFHQNGYRAMVFSVASAGKWHHALMPKFRLLFW